MPIRHFIGLSSGSNLRSVDAALVRTEGVGPDLRLQMIAFDHQEHPADLAELLHRCVLEEVSLRDLALVHRALGETQARACRLLAEHARFPLPEVACVGMTGQTVRLDLDGRLPSVLSIGMAEAVAERTGLTVLSHWAARDVLLGGQAVPLTAPLDALQFAHARENRCLVHLGGSAAATWLPAGSGRRGVLGFAAAPCGWILDGLMALLTRRRLACDPWGKHAVQGRCVDDLLDSWLQHPLLLRRPTAPLTRSDFGREFLEQGIERVRALGRPMLDLLCTATHFVAQTLVRTLRKHLPDRPDRILLCGGGTRNGFLIRLLEELLTPVVVEKTDSHGLPAEAHKAWAAAGWAALTLDGIPGHLPSATGASGARLLGSFVPGNSGHWARCLAWMASQTAPLVRKAA